MMNIFFRKDDESSKIEARENDIMHAIEAKIFKPKSEDDLFGILLAEKLKKLPFEINLQAKNEIDNIMFKYSIMSHNSSKQPGQVQQVNTFSNHTSSLSSTPTTPRSSYPNNEVINMPASPEFANNRINFPQLQTPYTIGTAFSQYMQSKHVQ